LRYINLISKSLQTINTPGLSKAFLRNPSLASLSSFKITAELQKYQPTFQTIFDIGANIGQFAFAALNRFPDAIIYSFEPVPDAFKTLRSNVKNYSKIEPFNLALGNCNGTIKFYRNDYTQVSSHLKIDKANQNPNFSQEATSIIEVDISRLDDFSQQHPISNPVLIKMDVQGMEKDVLLGGTNFLRFVEFVLFEVPLVPLYENQPLFDEMHHFMNDMGFKLVAPLGFNEGLNGKIIELDLLYKRV
jgi:FkbM family methyltransferase